MNLKVGGIYNVANSKDLIFLILLYVKEKSVFVYMLETNSTTKICSNKDINKQIAMFELNNDYNHNDFIFLDLIFFNTITDGYLGQITDKNFEYLDKLFQETDIYKEYICND